MSQTGRTRAGATLIRTTFSALPGWQDDDHAAALRAFAASARAIVEGPAPDTLCARLRDVCESLLKRIGRRAPRSEARPLFEHHFEPFRLAHAPPSGLLTGYYEPLIEGARQRSTAFPTPLYRRPPDLVNMIAEADRARADVPLTHMRRAASGLEPFPVRAEIEAGALAGQGLELVFVRDAVDAFFAQVQGSVRVRLPDGKTIGLTYDGKNGHPYTSIGKVLIERGEIPAAEMSMQRLATWLRQNETEAREVMQHNASFVFFRETGDASATGVLGTPLVPGRSLAVDPAHHPLGLPVFVDAPGLLHWGRRLPFRRLMVAHDVGSAIRGPQRGDIYFGSGDIAAQRAGVTKHRGTMTVLLPRGFSPSEAPAP